MCGTAFLWSCLKVFGARSNPCLWRCIAPSHNSKQASLCISKIAMVLISSISFGTASLEHGKSCDTAGQRLYTNFNHGATLSSRWSLRSVHSTKLTQCVPSSCYHVSMVWRARRYVFIVKPWLIDTGVLTCSWYYKHVFGDIPR